jgi:hypothetical protein
VLVNHYEQTNVEDATCVLVPFLITMV